MSYGGQYAINGAEVYAPDEDSWTDVEIGEALDGTKRLSPVRKVVWMRRLAGKCDLDESNPRDWFAYRNQVLSSLTTRKYPDSLTDFETYTVNVICQSVTVARRRSVGNQVTAVFLVEVT